MKGFTKRLLFNRSLFRKLLLSYLVTVLVPTLLIISVYAYTIKEDLIAQMEQASEAGTHRTSKNIETVIDQINFFSLQLSFLPNLNLLLYNPNEFHMYDYYLLKEQVRKHIVPNQLFHSVYLYTYAGNKVITTDDGLFDVASFYDQHVIQQIREHSGSKSWWYQVRKPPAEAFWNPGATAQEDEFVTFYKAIPVTATKPAGMLVINIPKDMFIHTIYNMNNVSEYRSFILDSNGAVISRDGSEQQVGLNAVLSKVIHEGNTGMIKVTLDRQAYFASVDSVPSNGWKLVHMIPYRMYQDQLFEKLSGLFGVVVLVILIGLAVSYAYAVKMYNPWKRILEVLTATACKRQELTMRSESDEISFVSGAITSMIHTIKHNEPVIKDHLISDILQNNVLDQETIPLRMEQLGIVFKEPGFLVIICAFETATSEHSDDPQRKLVMFSLVSEALQRYFPCEGTMLDGSKLGFIVNVNGDRLDDSIKERIQDCYNEMSSMAHEQLDVSLQLCVGEVCQAANIHKSYEHVRREYNYKAVMGSRGVIFVQAQQSDSKFVYPLSLQKQLIHTIVSLNRTKAAECIEELFEQYFYNSNYAHEKLQGMLVVLMGSIINELMKEGYDVWCLNEEIAIFKLNECRNKEQLRQYLCAHIDKIISFLEAWEERRNSNWHVSKAIEYMEQHFANNISITDIAEYVGVSSGHLSRTFKADTGKSMLEYLTEYRMAKSKELLANRPDPLHEICQSLGYNDVQSFIRFFKKYEGITPGEYRKSIGKM